MYRYDRCDWYREMYWRDRRAQDRDFYRLLDYCSRPCYGCLDWKHWHWYRYSAPMPTPTPTGR